MSYIDTDALARVIVAALILGAGLPAMFAFGVRALVPAGQQTVGNGRRAVAGLCFAVCVAAIVAGIVFIVSGGH